MADKAQERKPLCGKCDGGWIAVPDFEARKLYKDPNAMAMLRCDCRKPTRSIFQPRQLQKKAN